MTNINKDKTSIKYWEGKVAKRKQKDANGNESVGQYFSVNFKYANKGAYVCLQTDNKYDAAQKARDAYLLLKAKGWEAMWEIYRVRKNREAANRQDALHRGETDPEKHEKREGEIKTIGEFIEKVKQICFARPKTLHDYVGALYRIVSDIYNIDYGDDKYDYRGGKNLKRIAEIGKIKMSEITPDKIEAWKNNSLKLRIEEDPDKYDSAVVTINSILRGAKNLFSRRNLKALGPAAGVGNPFAEIEFFKESSHRYVTKFNAKELISDAQDSLKPINKNAYIAVLLALCAGFRRNEIDKLMWEQIDFEEGVLSIRATPYFKPKSNESSSDVRLAKFVIDELECHRAETEGTFVLPSKINPIQNATWGHCRCERDYDVLNKWLRERGIVSQKPLHTLRKEYGAQICRQHGLYIASRALRHSSYSVTEKHYTDKTALVVPCYK
ncbi:MAG: site-specific integrase [Puniceicoccales bacterium]|jgi:integrase|nr:site-specific integrase [Puniceicoccales bacterium]